MKWNQCKYADECKHYQESSVTCNAQPGKYCGVYRGFHESKNKASTE